MLLCWLLHSTTVSVYSSFHPKRNIVRIHIVKMADVINIFVLFFGNRQLNFKQLFGTGKETLPKKGV